MRLVSYEAGSAARAGLLRGDRVHDIWGEAFAHVRGDDRTLDAVLRGDLLRQVEPAEGEGLPVEGLRLLPPVGRPGKIVCIGLNYRSHCEEQGIEAPETPTFFAKFATALAAPGATVPLPAWSDKVDYEAEVAFVIGKRGKDVPEASALEHVAGYMLFNDLSARDYQFKTPQWMPGKTFDGAAPTGPALVTPDEAGPHDAIEIELRLGGEVMQRGSTADLVHSIPALVAYLSQLMTLEPGDVVATGTPSGVGSLRDPRVWLKAGDEIEISSPQLGTLGTRIS
ncbi:MAG TPA: fumarylacetoacetate hydrolase family protein [Thermoleophilaceae bacterium]|nr:fumarylacetoacetate hydrolase family protein [Thermoleophilaceae bacterium]